MGKVEILKFFFGKISIFLNLFVSKIFYSENIVKTLPMPSSGPKGLIRNYFQYFNNIDKEYCIVLILKKKISYWKTIKYKTISIFRIDIVHLFWVRGKNFQKELWLNTIFWFNVSKCPQGYIYIFVLLLTFICPKYHVFANFPSWFLMFPWMKRVMIIYP